MTNQNEQNNQEFEKLEEFSEDLIKLGQDISVKLKEKEQIEKEIAELEKQASALRSQIFNLKEKLIKISSELAKLEEKRKQIEGV